MEAVLKETKSSPIVKISKKYTVMSEEVANDILKLSRKKIKEKGSFTIALSGGSTPKGVYLAMANKDYIGEFDWENIHFFWTDERFVDADDIKSNYRMVAEALITKIDIPPQNIHPIKTQVKSPKIAAEKYEEELRSFFELAKGEFPTFDLVLLGLGQDGHTASLFPGTEALEEKERLAVSVKHDELAEERISLTYPVINHAKKIMFIVSGREKSDILKKALDEETAGAFPAGKIRPENGELVWYVDVHAAALISS
jgi:6-phosphogluconolactonase